MEIKELQQFLHELEQNNYKDWFEDNKWRYQALTEQWKAFSLELIDAIGRFDRDIAGITLRECSYRIYRDTIYSHDKTPYKTHFDIYLAPGGKRSLRAGYYFRVGSGSAASTHRMAAGNCYHDPKTIKLLREDISYGWPEFRDQVLGQADPRMSIYMEGANKRLPHGTDPHVPYADWLRVRTFALSMPLDDAFVQGPDLPQRLADIFRTAKPFVDYVNRAATYTPD